MCNFYIKLNLTYKSLKGSKKTSYIILVVTILHVLVLLPPIQLVLGSFPCG
jgi:hypothetical protein